MEESCDGLVQQAWEDSSEGTISAKLAAIMKTLNTWSQEVLGDLKKRIMNLKAELEIVRRKPISESQIRREQTISFKLEKLEEQEDLV